MDGLSDPTTLGFNLVHYDKRDLHEIKVWSRHDKAKSFLRYEQVEFNPYWKQWRALYIRPDGFALWEGPSFDTFELAYVHAGLSNWGQP